MVVAGVPIVAAELAAPGSGAGLVASIEPGMRAMAIKVNEVVGVAGFVLPNTFVDIISVQNNVAETVLKRVEVLAIAQQTFVEEGKAKVVSTVTLELSPKQVFPFRSETIPVFKWAIKTRPGQWKPYYYLGLIYWSKGKTAETNLLFEKCNNPEFAPFYIIQAHLNKDLSLPYYLKALNINNKDWRNWHFITKYYNQNFQYMGRDQKENDTAFGCIQ